jgi:hypothetical protein
MKKILSFISGVLVFISCSTNNNNGTVTVIPLAPGNLTGTVVSTTQINLSWTDNSTNEDGYKIERKTGNGNYAVVGSMGADLTTYNDLGLTPNTSYTYRVYAYNSAGNSLQYSNEVTVSTQDSIPSWLTNGLVAFYPFNGNANDESGNGNNGTVNGATLTTDRNGNVNKAYSFDGVNDNIITNNITFSNGGDYTISLWVNLALGYQNGFPQHYLLSNAILNNGTYLNADTNEHQFSCNSLFSNISIGNWHHYVALKSGSTFTLFIDEVNIGSNDNCNRLFINGNPIFLGSTDINTEYLKGKLDDIRIYNRALSASEVSYLATH